jgi:hypothetical protein
MSTRCCASVSIVLLLVAPMLAQAAGSVPCSQEVAVASFARMGQVVAIASEFSPAVASVAGGVLAPVFDETLAVDAVLARLRSVSCRAMLRQAAGMTTAGAGDAAAYKPKTAFDNTPWRFNMTQNGKRMTADEFDAWMKARGVRVVGRKDGAEATAAPAGSSDAAH